MDIYVSASLCPLAANASVRAWGAVPVNSSQAGSIPSIAFGIPDVEGFARLQVFANSSKTQIGCFQAVLRNGNTLSHLYIIPPILGAFTLAAILASFATAIYGVSLTHMRTHYAHSLSALIIFDTFQSFFLTGALSVNWPSILPAWWSNFAWSAGVISSKALVTAIDGFAGVRGNASQVGGAGSTIINTGGGSIIRQIYGRALASEAVATLLSRAEEDATNARVEYPWAGTPSPPGMPMPGTWRGFASSLAAIDASTPVAFLLGLIWWLVGIALVILSITLFKFILELLAKMKRIKEDRLQYFRSHFLGYLGLGVLRTLIAGIFPILTLALFEFHLRAPVGPTAIAGLVFTLLIIGVLSAIILACRSRYRSGSFHMGKDTLIFGRGKIFKVVPFITTTRSSSLGEKETTQKPLVSLPWVQIKFVHNNPNRETVHKDVEHIKSFGWLSARYRRRRWWFFICWLAYQVIRALFVGGAANSPLAQVFGIFMLEVVAFMLFAALNPFEGSRNTSLAIWMLGISKVVTSGLSVAFLSAFSLDRSAAAIVGMIIMIVQGLVVVAIMVLIGLSLISTMMSLSRNKEEFSDTLDGVRIRYFEHLDKRAADLSRHEKREIESKKAEERAARAGFSVNKVRRAPKIEDEDEEVEDEVTDLDVPNNNSVVFPPVSRPSRANSVSSRYSVGNLPAGARPHRPSWSAKDFAEWDAQPERPPSALARRMSGARRSGSLRQASLSQLRLETASPVESQMSPTNGRRPMTAPNELAEEKDLVKAPSSPEDYCGRPMEKTNVLTKKNEAKP
jgi:hypothetical protein